MKKHVNIPIFIPHMACPYQCSFCDQRRIAGARRPPDPDEVYTIIQKAIRTVDRTRQTCEIAFFGGSFTGIGAPLMRAYLDAAAHFCGQADGIRLSTRPDYIDDEVIGLLRAYPVTTIELGAQSMDDAVLRINGRGHSAQDTLRAASRIRAAGFSLVMQMMTGLPGDTPAGAKRTAETLCSLRPDAVRIYPCVVVRGTELERRYRAGEYTPASLRESVSLCADLRLLFERAGAAVIRLGLHADSRFAAEDVVAGPFHPAFGEMCENAIFYKLMYTALAGFAGSDEVCVHVAPQALSKAVGQRRANVTALERALGIGRVRVRPDAGLAGRRLFAVPAEKD